MYQKIFKQFACFGVVLGVTAITLITPLSAKATSTNTQAKQVNATEPKQDKNQPPVQPSIIPASVKFTLPGHVYSLTFSSDGKTLVGGGADNGASIAIWSIGE